MDSSISIWGWISLAKCTLVLASAIGWGVGWRHFGKGTGWLGAQLAAAFLAEAAATWLSFQGANNLRVYDAYIVLECFLMGGYLCSYLVPRRGGVAVLALCIAAYTAVAVHELPLAWCQRSFITTTYVVGGLLLVALSIFGLFHIAMRSDIALARVPVAWVLLGTAVFFGGTIPLLGLTNLLIERQVAWAGNIYFINDGLFTFRYGSIIVATIIGLRSRTSPFA